MINAIGFITAKKTTIAFQIKILAQTSEVSKTSEVFRVRHFSEKL
jgi:hypothetical protein